ncbi:MAG TPA: hypothetical protein VG722_02125, partial [Tepidisphaeraceae bacterium]|nr:hypothetical protein [Tepidisphaeraceae bacterium]
ILVEAGELPAADSPRSSSLEYRVYPPYPKAWWDMAFESEQENARQFQLLRQSRLLMESDGQRSGIPQGILSDRYNAQRNLANIVGDGAIFSHLNGNDAEATGRILDCLNMANCIGQNHTLVAQLVAMGISALSEVTTEIVAPSLRVGDGPKDIVRQNVRQLITELADEKPVRTDLANTLKFELPSMFSGTPRSAKSAHITRAGIQRDEPLLVKASELENLPTSLALIAKGDWPRGAETLDRIFITEFRILADRRMAAIALAAQLYRADHKLQWPAKLEQLVPAYLPSVPSDPYRKDNAEVGYKIIPHGWPDGRDRPVVYVDSGPDVQVGSEPLIGWQIRGRKMVRQYRDLSSPREAVK